MPIDLKQTCLRELATRIVTIPAHWGTAGIYEELVADGLAAPVINTNPLMSGFVITDAGRAALPSTRGTKP